MTAKANLHSTVALVALTALAAGCQQIQGVVSKVRSTSDRAIAQTPLANPLPPVKVTANSKLDIQQDLARSIEKKGKFDDAEAIYLEIIRQDDRRTEAHHRLAVLHDRKGEFDRAAEFYRTALQLDPNNADIHCDRGYSFYVQRRWAESEESLRRSLALQPNLKRAHNNLGLLLARTERSNLAMKQFSRAGCTKTEAHVNMAFVLVSQDRWEDAEEQYDLALAIDPLYEAAQQGLRALRVAQSNVAHQAMTAQQPRKGAPIRSTSFASLPAPPPHREIASAAPPAVVRETKTLPPSSNAVPRAPQVSETRQRLSLDSQLPTLRVKATRLPKVSEETTIRLR